MSKSINLQSKEWQHIFAEYSWFYIVRGLFFEKPKDFQSGGISCATVHENEAIISRNSKIFNPINTILP